MCFLVSHFLLLNSDMSLHIHKQALLITSDSTSKMVHAYYNYVDKIVPQKPLDQKISSFIVSHTTCFLLARDFELSWNKADNAHNPSPQPPLFANGCSLRRVLVCTPWRWVKRTLPKHGLLASTLLGCPHLPEVKCDSTSYTWGQIKRNTAWHLLEQTFPRLWTRIQNYVITLNKIKILDQHVALVSAHRHKG